MAYTKSLIKRISESYSYLNALAIKYSFLLTVIYALITISIVIWTLNKGLIFSDEAWYLLHLKGLPYISISEWPVYAKLFYPTNLLSIRYFTFSMFILSGFFLSLGMSRFYKQISLITLLPITLIGLFLFWSPVQFVPDYVTFNIFIFNTGIGCFLLMLSSLSLFSKYFWGASTGFLFGQLFFIMITNTPYIGLLFISIFFLKQHKKDLVHYWAAMAAGILLAVVFFFSMIKFMNYHLTDINVALSYLKYDGSHGLRGIVSWGINTVLYFVRDLIIPSFLLFFIISKIVTTKLIKFLAALFFVVYIAYLFKFNFEVDRFNITTPSPIFILVLFIMIMFIEKPDWQNLVVIVILFFIPFFASLGTNVKFDVRSTCYLAPLILFLFIFLRRDDLSKLSLVFHCILLIALIRFSTVFISSPGWQGYVIKNQKSELASIGINVNVKLDKRRIEEVNELKAIIPSHSSVLVSNSLYWGYIYLLELDVPYYYFNFSEDGWNNYYSKNSVKPAVLYLMEYSSIPFPESVKKSKDILKLDTIPLQINEGMNLYKITYR